MDKIKVGLIGLGRMGELYLRQMQKSENWDVAYICDTSPEARAFAREVCPQVRIVADSDEIFSDKTVSAIVIAALADSRKEYLLKAFAAGKHVISEKPIADSVAVEWEMVEAAEKSGVLTAVNLYLRNSWYHNLIRDFIRSGEIGELAVIRVCHMTPGLVPGEGHEHEGPAFHDCGMHYVDIARWYAESEFKTWNAQGVRFWGYKDPWWVQCHGTFENGVVFDITQGFVYGQLSKDQTHNCYIDIIGTKGIARMTHDFKTAKVELRGVSGTEIIERPFGGKNIDILCGRFAEAIRKGEASDGLPAFRDSAIASEYAFKFLEDSFVHDLPAIGDGSTLEAIRERRRNMKNGYGLLNKRHYIETLK